LEVQQITAYFKEYGSVIIFIIIFLEYLNLPGFPAGVIMPLCGIWAAKGQIGLGTAVWLSVLAGMCGSWLLYFLGRFGRDYVLDKYLKRNPKYAKNFEKVMGKLQSGGYRKYLWLLIAKLMPMVRTLVSIPAGVFRLNFFGYTVCSAIGVLIWNLVLIGAGYFFGDRILP